MNSDSVSVESRPQSAIASSKPAASPARHPFVVRVLFPSVADIVFIVLLVTFGFSALSARLLGDAGIGWHIRNGEHILATHAITRVDAFSSTMSGHAWYAWEWAYDALIAAIHHISGLNGVVFFGAVLIGGVFAATFRLALVRGSTLLVALGLVILAISASTIHFFARPHVFSWMFTIIWFQLLDSAEISPEKSRRLFWLPATTLLWVNLHGGFLLGFALLGIYLLAAAVRYVNELRSAQRLALVQETLGRTRVGQWLKTLGTISGLCVAASFVNPYGYKLYVHIYGYLTDRFLMNHIDEFRSPNFHAIAQQCFAALILITLVALASASSKLRASHLLVTIFAIYSGLYATRNLPTSSILLVLIIAPTLTNAMRDSSQDAKMWAGLRRFLAKVSSFDGRMSSMELSLTGHLWPAVIVLLGGLACMQQGTIAGTKIMNAHFDGKRFPVSAVDYLSQRNVHAPVFSPDYWGGYLIYRLYPQTQVVIDDRHDLYGDEFLKNYLKVVHVEPGWDTVLNDLNVEWVLAPTESPLSNILKIAPDWRVVYEGKTGTIFQLARTR